VTIPLNRLQKSWGKQRRRPIDTGGDCPSALERTIDASQTSHHVRKCLSEALRNLDKDRGFLKNGGVFDDDFIDAYNELKMSEVERCEMTPHPVEFDMYYSL
jgi:glutamine synthetase